MQLDIDDDPLSSFWLTLDATTAMTRFVAASMGRCRGRRRVHHRRRSNQAERLVVEMALSLGQLGRRPAAGGPRRRLRCFGHCLWTGRSTGRRVANQ